MYTCKKARRNKQENFLASSNSNIQTEMLWIMRTFSFPEIRNGLFSTDFQSVALVQAVLWRALAASPATQFLHIIPFINLALWLLALAILIYVSFTYILKCIFYFEAVKREYFHPVRVNFFFAPWVVCMFLANSVPPLLAPENLHPALWCAFMGPYFFLELKIYGQWLSGGKRRLCKVANPSSHLSVVGNFVRAILAPKVGWKEAAKLWAVGLAHYLVVFVTLYQRLPTSEPLPKELHPDVRINFFTGFGFSVALWSYTFPMTTASVTTIKYAENVPGVLSKGLALALSFMSSTMVVVLLVFTLLHAFVWHTLFPNDVAVAVAIAMKKRRLVKEKKPFEEACDI
ncbi:hypothetical protein BDE02_01G103500 [Populus trichocarpa]|nr:hypothetical protein BDE02_01G103500 [Populus trichocarpa]